MGLTRFHYVTQKSIQFKTYKLFISGIIHLYFQTAVDGITETTKSKTVDKGVLLNVIKHIKKQENDYHKI